MNVFGVGSAAIRLATIALPRSCWMILATRSPAADSSLRILSITAMRSFGGPTRRSITSALPSGLLTRASITSFLLAASATRLDGLLQAGSDRLNPTRTPTTAARLQFIVSLRAIQPESNLGRDSPGSSRGKGYLWLLSPEARGPVPPVAVRLILRPLCCLFAPLPDRPQRTPCVLDSTVSSLRRRAGPAP